MALGAHTHVPAPSVGQYEQCSTVARAHQATGCLMDTACLACVWLWLIGSALGCTPTLCLCSGKPASGAPDTSQPKLQPGLTQPHVHFMCSFSCWPAVCWQHGRLLACLHMLAHAPHLADAGDRHIHVGGGVCHAAAKSCAGQLYLAATAGCGLAGSICLHHGPAGLTATARHTKVLCCTANGGLPLHVQIPSAGLADKHVCCCADPHQRGEVAATANALAGASECPSVLFQASACWAQHAAVLLPLTAEL